MSSNEKREKRREREKNIEGKNKGRPSGKKCVHITLV
jgi:hypothetical protein